MLRRSPWPTNIYDVRVSRPRGSAAAVSELALGYNQDPSCVVMPGLVLQRRCALRLCHAHGQISVHRQETLTAGETACLQARKPMRHLWCVGDTELVSLHSKFWLRAHSNQMTTLSSVGFIMWAFCYWCDGLGLRCKNVTAVLQTCFLQ